MEFQKNLVKVLVLITDIIHIQKSMCDKARLADKEAAIAMLDLRLKDLKVIVHRLLLDFHINGFHPERELDFEVYWTNDKET